MISGAHGLAIQTSHDIIGDVHQSCIDQMSLEVKGQMAISLK